MSTTTPKLVSRPLTNINISTTPLWHQIWQQHFGTDNSGIWHPPENKGIAIPYRKDQQNVFGFKLRYANAATNSHSPRYDIIGNLDQPEHVFRQILKELNVSYLVFPYLSLNSTLMKAEPKLTMLHSLEICESAPYAETSGDWEEYWTNRGSSRRELGRRERKFMSKDGAKFEVLTTWDEINPVFKQLLEIEASGWKGTQGSSILQNEDTLNFYTDFCKQCAANNHLRLFVLYDENIPVAFEIDVEFDEILHCFKHGYLDSYSKLGAGQVLRIMVMRWAFENTAIKYFDMFGPETEAKCKWATNIEELYTLKIYANSPAGWLAWLRFSLAPKLKAKIMGNRNTKSDNVDEKH